MAKKTIIDAITKLYSKLGGNLSDVLGTRSNVNFMGTGKTSEGFLDMDLNVEALGALSQSKAVNELKSAVGFATADKLNDIQANKLLTNMMKMDEFYNPRQVTNITDMATGTRDLDAEGLASLRERTGDNNVPLRTIEEIIANPRKMADEANFPGETFAANPTEQAGMIKSMRGIAKGDSDLMKRLDEIVAKKKAEAAPPGSSGGDNFKVLNETLTQNETKYLKELIEDTGGGQFTSDIMQEVPSLKIIGNKISVNKQDINSLSKFLDDMYISDLAPSGPGVDKMPPRLRDSNNNLITKLLRSEKNVQTTPFDEAVEYNARPEDVVQNLVDQKFGIGYFDNVGSTPAQRGSAREFLVEALKKENPNQTNFADVVEAVDVKYITEGGGGLAGDPLTIVNKYFGPRIAEMVPSGASSEEIAIFTERVLNNVVDANGLRPTDPRFDRLTARFIENFARGGLAKILEV